MFVLLEHRTTDGIHWDFMVELAGAERLATWRLSRNPLEHRGAIEAARIGDHRRAYLDLEGDIGQGRGQVRRVDRGSVEVVTHHPACIVLLLSGDTLTGRVEIAAGPNGAEKFRRVVPDDAHSHGAPNADRS